MPDLDMKPDDYRVRGKDGRWFRRDDKRYLIVGLVMSIGLLTWIYLNRDAIEDKGLLVLGAALFGTSAGIFIGNLLKDVY